MKTKAHPSFLGMALALLLMLPACTPNHATSQELARDLQSYSAEMLKWEPSEKKVFDALDGVSDSQYVDDEFVLRSLKSAMPEIDTHLREVTAYRPMTPELSSLHERYRKGWENLRVGVDKMAGSIAKKDYIALAKGKSEMENARTLLLQTFAGMNSLMEENEAVMKSMKQSQS
jgi:hypothetical protein